LKDSEHFKTLFSRVLW